MNGDFKAKLNVAEITKFCNGAGGKIIMFPVTGDSEENKTFSQYTPSGKVELMITNEQLLKELTVGEYVVTFTKVIEQPTEVAHHNV